MQQEHRGAVLLARLEDVHAQAVDALDEARTDPGGQIRQSRKMRCALAPRTLSRVWAGSASTRVRHPGMSPMVCG